MCVSSIEGCQQKKEGRYQAKEKGVHMRKMLPMGPTAVPGAPRPTAAAPYESSERWPSTRAVLNEKKSRPQPKCKTGARARRKIFDR